MTLSSAARHTKVATPATGSGRPAAGRLSRSQRSPRPAPADRPVRRVGGHAPAAHALTGSLLALVLALTGCAGVSSQVRPAPPTPTTSPTAPATTIHRPSSADRTVPPMDRSLPVRITVQRVGINAPLMAVGRDSDGTVATPPFSVPHTAGWFSGSVTPGQQGTAVIVGHVDTRTGPAVFYPLSVTRPGDQVAVQRADHSVAEFTVDRIAVVARDDFDDAKVYGATGRPELRVITCGGTFDPGTQEYSSNVVVYAHLTGTRPA